MKQRSFVGLLRMAAVYISCTYAAQGMAQLQCSEVFFDNGASIQYQVTEPTTIRLFEQRKIKMDGLSRAAGVDPASLSILLKSSGNSAAYDGSTHSIETVVRFEKGRVYADQPFYYNHPKYGLAVFSHEYTHAIFERYMTVNSPSWRRVNERIDQGKLEIKNTLDEINGIFSQMSSESSSAQKQVLKDKIAIKMVQVKSLSQESADLKYLNAIMTAYHELVADVVPVLINHDAHVMRDALLTPNPAQMRRQDNLWRSFDGHFGAARLALWKKKVESDFRETQAYDSYSLLAPLRSYWGSTLLKRPLTEAELKSLLPKILDVLTKDFEMRFNQLGNKDTGLDIVRLNIELYNQLKDLNP